MRLSGGLAPIMRSLADLPSTHVAKRLKLSRGWACWSDDIPFKHRLKVIKDFSFFHNIYLDSKRFSCKQFRKLIVTALSGSRLQIWRRKNYSFVFLRVSYPLMSFDLYPFILFRSISLDFFSILRLNECHLILFFYIENLDRDQRRNLFAQEQSKKVFWIWISPSPLLPPLLFVLFTGRSTSEQKRSCNPQEESWNKRCDKETLPLFFYLPIFPSFSTSDFYFTFLGPKTNDAATGSWTKLETRRFWTRGRSSETGSSLFVFSYFLQIT